MLGYRDFKTQEEIKYLFGFDDGTFINDKYPGGFYNKIKLLKIFETSKQRTWLVRIEDELYFILDDRRKDDKEKKNPKKQYLISDKLNINYCAKVHNSGIISFGENGREWFFSKNLFNNIEGISFKKIIEDFIK